MAKTAPGCCGFAYTLLSNRGAVRPGIELLGCAVTAPGLDGGRPCAMRRLQPMILVTIAALVLGACGASDDTTSTGNGGDESTDTSQAEVGPVTIERDADAAVTETIGVDGGSLRATSRDGTTFDLTVPPGALAADTDITATPAALGATDIPTWVVMFEPAGAFFIEFATLEITTPDEIAVGEQLFFGVDDEAEEITAAPVDPAAATATLLVGHFSGYGLAKVTDPQRAALLQKGASDAEARIQSQMAEVLGREREAQLLGTDSGTDVAGELETALDVYQRDVIAPRLEAAGASCAATQQAVQTVIGFERMRQLLGIEAPSDINGFDVLTSALADGGPCEEEAIAECKEKKDPSIYIGFLLGRERTRQLLGLDSSGGSVADLIEKAERICSPRAYSASGSGGGVTITGVVPDLGQPFTLSGSGAGFSIELSYTPSDESGRSGTMTYSGSGGGSTLSGSSTYTVTGDADGPLTLTQVGDGCVDGGCANETEVVTLTPMTT